MIDRRGFLKQAGAATMLVAGAAKARAKLDATPVIDSHIHLFDPTRRGGVPWPESSNRIIYRPALPARYAMLAEPHGIVGAVAVECSPWMVDNIWLQELIEKNPLIVGYVGNLLPEGPEFGATLDRLHRSPYFLGIRYGNLWNRNLREAIEKADFVDGLQLLAQTGLVLDTANPDAALIAAVLRVTDRVPELRIVVDHLPNAQLPEDSHARADYESDLKALSHRPLVYVKGSEILNRSKQQAPPDPGVLKADLDRMWELFGEHRMLFGSDWPNSDTVADYAQTFSTAKNYIATRSCDAQERYFWRNSMEAYRWKPRSASQTRLAAGASGQSRRAG